MLRRCVRALTPAVAMGFALACENAGEDRVLSVGAMSSAGGFVYFDADGSREFAEPDAPMEGIGIALVAPGTTDTIVGDTTDADGFFAIEGIPVGQYAVSIVGSTLGDTSQVVALDSAFVNLTPDDTSAVVVGVGFPILDVAGARQAVVGTRAFVEGIAVVSTGAFGDTTLHIVDSTGTLRATRVRPPVVNVGDSVRLRGIIRMRDGDATLDDARAFLLGFSNPPTPEQIGTGLAADADSVRLHAALVEVRNAVIQSAGDVPPDFIMTVDDGTGPLDIVLDGDLSFDVSDYAPLAVVRTAGVLIPQNGGARRLYPRSFEDVVIDVAAVTVAEARALPLGRSVVITGVALNDANAYGDSVVHVQDFTSSSIRIDRIQSLAARTGDSVTVIGTTSSFRGRPMLTQGQVTIIGNGSVPAPLAVTTTSASTGGVNAQLDAHLIRVANVTLQDTSSAAVFGGVLEMIVDDGSGPLRVVLDAEMSWSTAGLEPGAVLEVTGMLMPADPVTWLLRPRNQSDIRITVPVVPVRTARMQGAGSAVVVTGVALNDRSAFGDASVHVVDTSGTIRVTNVSIQTLTLGDSARYRGVVTFVNGQPTLNADVTVLLGAGSVPSPELVTTAVANNADGGQLDAALVRHDSATIVGRSNQGGGDVLLTVNDGSGQGTILIDNDVPIDDSALLPGAVIDARGLLVPTGFGTWRLKPRSSGDVTVRIPVLTIEQARVQVPGTVVVIAGIALNARPTFGDTTVHVTDVSASIRATRVTDPVVVAGDSVRMMGRVSARDGQATLDQVTPVIVVPTLRTPPVTATTTANAATALLGRLDAALVLLSDATVQATSMTAEGLLLTVDDGSGAVGVLLDADIAFDPSGFTPGATLDVRGVLVPAGNAWIVKPRAQADIVPSTP